MLRENGDERERCIAFYAYNRSSGSQCGGYGFSVRESEQRQVERLYMIAKSIAGAMGISLEMTWHGEWK